MAPRPRGRSAKPGASPRQPSAATVTGTLGANGWYTSDVAVSWSTTDAESDITTSACSNGSVTEDTAETSFTCTATSAGGTATETVTIKRDATVPAISYGGNAGSYSVDQTVAITCLASDVMSGVASNTCADVGGDAYDFVLGTNSFSATATDGAGNTASETTSFSVSVTRASLCTLVERWVRKQGVANAMCQQLRQNTMRSFINHVEAQSGKSIAADKAAILIRLAGAL